MGPKTVHHVGQRAAMVRLGCGFLAIYLSVCALLHAQQAPVVSVSPSYATMRVGESRQFRAVDPDGHGLRNVDWWISDPDYVEVMADDVVTVTARKPGSLTLRAHAGDGTGEAHIEVVESLFLQPGTVLWKAADIPGCHTTSLTKAHRVANGPDVFEESLCEDGVYIRAYTAEGLLLWRRKIGPRPDPAAPPHQAEAVTQEVAGKPIDTRAASICDSVSIGTTQEALQALVKSRGLAFTSVTKESWTVEEAGAACKLWFDSALTVTKKRKTLTVE